MPIENIGAILASTKQIGGTPGETAVAKAWLVKHVNDFDRVEVEVGLGPGLDLGPGAPANMQRCASTSWRPRADMICWRAGVPTIIECKERIDGRAIGQLLVYAALLRQDTPTIMTVYKVAAGVSVIEGVSEIFWRYDIEVELFPAAILPTAE